MKESIILSQGFILCPIDKSIPKQYHNQYDDGFNDLRSYISGYVDNNMAGTIGFVFGTFNIADDHIYTNSIIGPRLYNPYVSIDDSYSSFLCHADKYALNLDGEFVPFDIFEKYYTRYYAKYGKEGKMFIRPNDGRKSFPSGVFDIEKDLPNLLNKEYDNCHLLYVSSPKNIALEIRFFVWNGKIQTYSIYRINRENIEFPNIPPEAIVFLENYLNENKNLSQGVIVIDIALCPDTMKYHLLEFNNYFTSGPYKCSPEKILEPCINYIQNFKTD